MGELAASGAADDVLVTIGLGSCIGLALVDGARGIGGLAHIVLPEAGSACHSNGAGAAKFADRAVPALLERVTALGALRASVEAFLVGGAQMFSLGDGAGLDVGSRNEEATRAALERAGLRIRATA